MNLKSVLSIFKRKKRELPPEIEKLIKKHDRDPDKAIKAIDKLLTENQVRLEKLKREAFSLESTVKNEKAKIESGDLSERQENLVLDNISRLDMRLDAIEGEMRILTENISVVSMLEGKIRESQAMALKGFSEEQIENMLIEHGEKKEEYLQVVASADAEREYDPLKAQHQAKREALKAKIMSEKAARDQVDQEEAAAQTETESETEAPEPEPEIEPPPRREPTETTPELEME